MSDAIKIPKHYAKKLLGPYKLHVASLHNNYSSHKYIKLLKVMTYMGMHSTEYTYM